VDGDRRRVGSLVATVVAPKVGARYGRGRVFILASLGSALALMLLGMQRTSLGALVLVAAFRCLWATAAILCVMITQLTTTDALQGRAIGVQQLIVDAGSPAGTLLVGAAGSIMGVGAAMTAAGVVLAGITLFVFARGTPLRTVP
jgi:predicted MFS family arabinose efflux permease